MAATLVNQHSSRSHAIITISIQKTSQNANFIDEVTFSKLSIIDLAGSERGNVCLQSRSKTSQMEGGNINKSLLALGNCINILGDKSKRNNYVPYRDSKLTRILKDSLGGNCRTVMIACISPSSLFYDESLNTLNYAVRARSIKNQSVRNVQEVEVDAFKYKQIITKLESQIKQMQAAPAYCQTCCSGDLGSAHR